MSEITFIYTTFSGSIEATDICKQLLAEGLIACANRMQPMVSHYMWDGQMQSEEEHPVLLKTSSQQAEAAMARLAELHRYDVPAISCWKAEATSDFARWVNAETGAEEKSTEITS